MKLNSYFQISWWKTLYFNFKMLPLKDALKLPVILFKRTGLKSLKGKLRIDQPVRHGMIKIGRADVSGREYAHSLLQIDGILHFHGKATIGSGSVLMVGKQGTLSMGNKFRITGACTIFCNKEIAFGNEVLISWDTLFMDSDQHDVISVTTNQKLNADKAVRVGDHVWIGCRCTVLKGCVIPDHCIVSAGSILKGVFQETHCVLGHPQNTSGTVLKTGIDWIE